MFSSADWCVILVRRQGLHGDHGPQCLMWLFCDTEGERSQAEGWQGNEGGIWSLDWLLRETQSPPWTLNLPPGPAESPLDGHSCPTHRKHPPLFFFLAAYLVNSVYTHLMSQDKNERTCLLFMIHIWSNYILILATVISCLDASLVPYLVSTSPCHLIIKSILQWAARGIFPKTILVQSPHPL